MKFLLKIKSRVYQNCVRSAMLHGDEPLRLRNDKVATSRRTEKTIMRANCDVKFIEKSCSLKHINLLDLGETSYQWLPT